MTRFQFNSVSRHVLLVLALVASAAAACGGVVASAEKLSQAEAFASDPIFDPVGWLAGVTPSGNVLAGSAVLVAPQWVLTAGHVVDPQYNPIFPAACRAGARLGRFFPADDPGQLEDFPTQLPFL